MKEFDFYYALFRFLATMHGLFLRKTRKVSHFLMLCRKSWDESNGKPNKTCIDKSSEFYIRSIKLWLKDNGTNNEEKSVVDERFIRTLKNKIYKYMTSLSKMCILVNWMI